MKIPATLSELFEYENFKPLSKGDMPMPSKFNERKIKEDLIDALQDHTFELSSDEFNDLMDDLLPVVEDIFYKGLDIGKQLGFEQRDKLDKLIKDVEEEESLDDVFSDIEDDFYFPSEPE